MSSRPTGLGTVPPVTAAEPAASQELSADLRGLYAAEGSTTDVVVRGGVLLRHLKYHTAKAHTVPADQIERLADDPEVEFVSPDRSVRATAFSGTSDYGWMTYPA